MKTLSMIGIQGTQSIEKNTTGDSETIKIRKSGTMRFRLTPLPLVICEDQITKEVISLISSEINKSFKIIEAGSWHNLVTMLYGILFYKEQLREARDEPSELEILCVIDGDINEEDIRGRIKKTNSGILKSALIGIVDNIEKHIDHLTLAHLPSKTKGKPELNHKTWLEEISEEHIQSIHQKRISELELMLKKVPKEKIHLIEIELSDIKKQIEETITIITHSKSITPEEKIENKRGKETTFNDYHNYYKNMERLMKSGNSFMEYSAHMPVYTVLSIIRKYNETQWELYTKKIRSRLLDMYTIQIERYSSDHFNDKRI